MMNRMSQSRLESGQILLIVTLTMVVALTVGLSIVSRVITNLKTSKQNEESQRAFQAAQAGIEKALRSNTDIATTQFSNNTATQFSAKVNKTTSAYIKLNAGDPVSQDLGIDVLLSQNQDFTGTLYTGTMMLYWGDPVSQTNCASGSGFSSVPAIEVIILSGLKSDPSLSKYFYDGCLRGNGATAVTPGTYSVVSLGESYRFNATLPAVTSGLLMKVVPVYNSTKVALVSGNGIGQAFSNQGTTIISTGQSGDTTRKFQYFSAYPQTPPEIFQYAIMAQN